MRPDAHAGMTLIEALMVVAILAIIATAALPSMRDLIERQHLRGAAADIHAEFLTARMEALRRNIAVSLSFSIDPEAGRWCLAPSDNGACNCFHDDDCVMTDAPVRIMRNDGFGAVAVSTNFSDTDTATFHPVRGTANAGTVRLGVGDNEIEIRVSSLGRVRICSNDLHGYPSC